MPQLNPTPWFSFLILAWLTLLIFVPAKVLAHIFPNTPTVADTKSSKTSSWDWKW